MIHFFRFLRVLQKWSNGARSGIRLLVIVTSTMQNTKVTNGYWCPIGHLSSTDEAPYSHELNSSPGPRNPVGSDNHSYIIVYISLLLPVWIPVEGCGVTDLIFGWFYITSTRIPGYGNNEYQHHMFYGLIRKKKTVILIPLVFYNYVSYVIFTI